MSLDELPRVSVVMPVYNGEQFLAEAIQSVLAQTYNHYELIIVDDGSTDGSSTLAKRFEGGVVRYLSQSNGGVSKAMNSGISAARGEYVAFLNQDDIWLPEKLDVQVAYLESHIDVGAVYCQGQLLEN